MINELDKLNRFIQNSKNLCITPHIDADGLTSASLLTLYIQENFNKFPKFSFPLDTRITNSNISFYRNNSIDLVIFLDLSIKNLELNSNIKYLVIDHHIRDKNQISSENYIVNPEINSTVGLLFRILYNKWSSLDRYIWLVYVGALGDKDKETIELIKEKLYSNYTTEEIKIFNKLSIILNSLRAYLGKYSIYGILSLLELARNRLFFLFGKTEVSRILIEKYKETRKYINRALSRANITIFPNDIILIEVCSKFYIHSSISSSLLSQFKDKTVVVANLCLDKDRVFVEVRSLNRNCYELVRDFCKLINSHHYGGHQHASGCDFKKEYYIKFKEYLKNL